MSALGTSEVKADYKIIKDVILQSGHLIDHIVRYLEPTEVGLIGVREAYGSLVIQIHTLRDFAEKPLDGEIAVNDSELHWYKVKKETPSKDVLIQAIHNPVSHGVNVPLHYRNVIIRDYISRVA